MVTAASHPCHTQPRASRRISISARLRTSDPATARIQGSAPGTGSRNPGKAPKSGKRGLVAAVLVAGAAGWAWLFLDSGSSSGSEIYPTKFTPFTVTSREQVSPTAFILTVRNDQPGQSSINPSSVKAAWQHGLWSVEIKQPQLQIARHYTPLPPAEDKTGDSADELRFLVRRMDTGEMSNYLSRRAVGDQIWLRGPHLSFDMVRRLGAAQQVVFLAGGTGIAPALQAAHRLLDNSNNNFTDGLPTVSILWANRQGADALGREGTSPGLTSGSGSSWSSWWHGSKAATPRTIDDTSAPAQTSASLDKPSLSAQINDMKRRYGSRFEIQYFVDDEKSFITQDSVIRVLPEGSLPTTATMMTAAEDSARCTWHSPTLLERMSGDNDVDRARDPVQSACTCSNSNSSSSCKGRGAGKNLFFVSGPDGFIRAYAGSKWWHSGLEMQGTLRGVVDGMMRSGAMRKDEWLVLKL
ncbi:hypothetical protein Micbo1qcDRAFT_203369 [Microdochium bolleyi]|uniref:FAD-binding FR-type domain-containing protein n=1 Tax=Microdochium bolleyi TaxID=196109 RepID=A0A136J7X2_9PEZI|nr:hypothetical protein Micbo1qcDRAFT_203369 [Microdochium bolleyi]